ncbi:Starch-binding associating with outer membrane [Filimonas lacunae]|uniref:Starch-binding associating with outer membrane n=1 Tax=Filimonas lacunae TaxID=477680 RepID=A0A173MI83_9BACT|nr:SusD/RagB family nutrient-binding outer membrane lipoprotein [Filimonas lacunae]BAV07200.1 hypothetical protein FLA_3223 [Filimonas lacunae]SIS93354.1 Starch-binding associating with outer membrane [Filimonas lacunae]
MKSLLKIQWIAVIAAMGIMACKKGLDINNDPTKPTTATLESLITGAEKKSLDIIYGNAVNGKIGMLYAQYWSQGQKETDSRYQLDETSNSTIWSLYQSALGNLNEILRINAENPESGSPNQVAIANILSVWIYQVLADCYGNVPYSQALAGLDDFTPVYDDAATIYDSLVKKLDAQVALLDTAAGGFRSGELIYNSDVAQWKKLANSLKLRIGLRMLGGTEVNAAKAKTIIEAAATAGVLNGTDDDALFPYLASVGDQFPFNEQSGTGISNEFVASETLVKYMQSVNDPRLPVYVRPSSDDKAYVGKPYGINASDNQYNLSKLSFPGARAYDPTLPGIIMTSAEVEFALAEAAARNYAVSGTAAEHYEKGIRYSFAFWGLSDDSATSYLARMPYVANDWRNVIGVQKWLALYMQGLQAWFERNRLDFSMPGGEDLFVAPVAGSLDATAPFLPTRLTYPVSEANINRVNYTDAGKAIGGDTKGTKLWWMQ